MALVVRAYATSPDQGITISYRFDDATGAGDQIIVDNSGNAIPITMNLYNAAGAIFWSRTKAPGTGQTIYAAAFQMTAYTNKQGLADWRLPFGVEILWG